MSTYLVAHRILPEALAAPRELLSPSVPPGHHRIHEVHRAAHEAEVVVGTELERLALVDQFLARVGNLERNVHGVAGCGRGVEHEVTIPRIELQVVELRDGP